MRRRKEELEKLPIKYQRKDYISFFLGCSVGNCGSLLKSFNFQLEIPAELNVAKTSMFMSQV